MSVLTFADVVEALTGTRPRQATQVITDAVVDPRRVNPGCLFVALPDQQTGITGTIAGALDRGMTLALVQEDLPQSLRTLNLQQAFRLEGLSNQDLPLCLRVEDTLAALHQIAYFWRHKRQPTTIAVTGSVGKTTTKDLVVDVLGQRYRTLKNSGVIDSEIEIPLALLRLTGGHHRAVLEINVPGRTDFFGGMVSPHVGVVTNVGTTHIDETSSQAELAYRMAAIVKTLPPDGYAILNYDDPWVRGMASNTQATPVFYGLSPKADLWADGVEGMGLEGVRFRLHYGDETIHLRVPLIGRHSVHTALRAAAVGIVEGFTWQEIVRGLRFGNTQLHLVAVRSYHGALLLDDTYNASPDSTLAALNLLDEMAGRKVAVLGGMPGLGAYHYQGHQLVGLRAAQVVDQLVTVGDLGREMAAPARMAWLPASDIIELDDTDQAIDYLNRTLTAEDVVLIKGPHVLRMDRIAAALEADE